MLGQQVGEEVVGVRPDMIGRLAEKGRRAGAGVCGRVRSPRRRGGGGARRTSLRQYLKSMAESSAPSASWWARERYKPVETRAAD